MKIRIPSGCSVCFQPNTGELTTLQTDLFVNDAKWSVNGQPGWVFNYQGNQPTAYSLDWETIKEID
jgi:hypothetical protein